MTNTEFVRGEFQSWIELVSNLGFTDIVSPEDGFAAELSSRPHGLMLRYAEFTLGSLKTNKHMLAKR